MNIIYRLIYLCKVWFYSKTGVTPKKILKLTLFSYKHRIHYYNGLCSHLVSVQEDLDCKIRYFEDFKEFSEPEHYTSFWWPVDDRKSRIEFLKDLISKQD